MAAKVIKPYLLWYVSGQDNFHIFMRRKDQKFMWLLIYSDFLSGNLFISDRCFAIPIMSILLKVKRFIPSIGLMNKLRDLYDSFLISTSPARHRGALRKVRNKARVKVAFFVNHSSIWKCDELYLEMEKDEKFEPLIIICPVINRGEEIMHKEMNEAFTLFFKKNYNVVMAYNPDNGKWLDIRNEVKPDIVFFTNPHMLSRKEYYINNFLDKLTCYIPYTFQVTFMYDLQYDQLFHNIVWKAFLQTELHKVFAEKHARNKGKNVIVSGYPGIDIFRDRSYLPADRWKIKDPKIKRIIWAPHHSIYDDVLSFSNFFKYQQTMLDIAEKYSDTIQIAFKPHPILFAKLLSDKEWGKEKAGEYYLKWKNLPNGQLEEADYVDLFLLSDAMIHDSDSFMAEYLAVNKPVLHTVRDARITQRLNEFGKLAFEQHYHAHSKEDIYDFIENIVISGNDPKRNQRETFYMNYMKAPGNITASANIFNEINREIGSRM